MKTIPTGHRTSWMSSERLMYFNPFVSNASFLYPLKTSENSKVFWCFQGVERGCIGNKWFKVTSCAQRVNIRYQNSWSLLSKILLYFWKPNVACKYENSKLVKSYSFLIFNFYLLSFFIIINISFVFSLQKYHADSTSCVCRDVSWSSRWFGSKRTHFVRKRD